jgi:alkylation response protein AidB-like acyl-CoA dehydrogenase
MDFEFSADQELLRDSVRRLLADRAPIASLRERYGTERHAASAASQGLAQLGVVGLLVPETFGGAGMGMVDAAVVLEELGRALYIGPYASSAIGAVSLLGTAGDAAQRAQLLPDLTTGEAVGTFAVYEPGRRYDWRTPATLARPDGSITGTKAHVADACDADIFLVSAADAGRRLGVHIVRADDAGVQIETTASVDGTHPEATVVFDNAAGVALRTEGIEEAIAATFDRLAVAACVDGVGAAARALELVVAYAQERIAFDKPIGSFQAIQHLCADMLRTVELGRAAAYYACWAADAAPAAEAHRAATIAAAFAAEAFPQLGGTAIQVFGGIGFTWEHDIHMYYKRLLSVGYRLGSADHHLAELAGLVI